MFFNSQYLCAVFIVILLTTAGCSSSGSDFSICSPVEFGAVGDGMTLDTAALQECLDRCAGGIVEIPPGTYATGTLYPHSGTTIRLAKGARLRGTTDGADWTHPAVVWIEGVHGVAIEGAGVIEGNGPYWWEE